MLHRVSHVHCIYLRETHVRSKLQDKLANEILGLVLWCHWYPCSISLWDVFTSFVFCAQRTKNSLVSCCRQVNPTVLLTQSLSAAFWQAKQMTAFHPVRRANRSITDVLKTDLLKWTEAQSFRFITSTPSASIDWTELTHSQQVWFRLNNVWKWLEFKAQHK